MEVFDSGPVQDVEPYPDQGVCIDDYLFEVAGVAQTGSDGKCCLVDDIQFLTRRVCPANLF